VQKRPLFLFAIILPVIAAVILLLSNGYTGPAFAQKSYQNALTFYREGNLPAARGAIIEAVNSPSVTPPMRLLEAEIALGLFDGAGARGALARAMAQGVPANQVAHLLGHAYWLEGENDAALRQLTRQDIPAEKRSYAHRIRARVLIDKGDYAAAQQAFDAALQLSPKDSLIWTDLARLRFVNADRRGAIEAVDVALRFDPNQVRALELRGQLIRNQFGVVAALPWFERGLQINPDDLALLEQYALTLGDAGRYRDMLRQARRILKLDAGNPTAFYAQAVLAARAKHFNLASRLLARAGPAYAERPSGLLLAGVTEYAQGNFNLATDHLLRLLALQPDNARVRQLLAQAMYRAGDPLDALDMIKPIAIRDDADSYSLTIAARAFEASDATENSFAPLNDASFSVVRAAQPLAASTTLEAAAAEAERTPDNARILLPYIRLLLANGQGDAALGHARRLQANNPGVPDAHLIVGDVLAFRGEYPAAIQAYQQTRQISFTEPVMIRLVDAQSRVGNNADASATLAAFLAYNPDNLSALRLAGYRALDARQWTPAIYSLEKVVARNGYNDPILLINLARAYAGAGRKGKAVEVASIAYRIMPSNALVTRHYGGILLASGKKPKAAREMLAKAAAMVPNDLEILRDLKKAETAYGKSIQGE
jgi:tetratricopeptide (TPR) repeat protein